VAVALRLSSILETIPLFDTDVSRLMPLLKSIALSRGGRPQDPHLPIFRCRIASIAA
jgi:hypothetical protein